MHLVWHGTAAVEVVCSRGRILFDPFVPLKGSCVQVGIEAFDGFTNIFVTHGHFDHIFSLPEIVRRNPSARIYCTGTPHATLNRKGVSGKNLVLIYPGDVLDVFGFMIRVLQGRHADLPGISRKRLSYALRSSARGNVFLILKENRICVENGETVFYQIEADGKQLSLMGSLNLREDVVYPTGADLLVLPYNGWEDNCPPAVKVIERMRPKRVVLDHYDDTFPPVTMPVDLSPILEKYPGLVTALTPGKETEI